VADINLEHITKRYPDGALAVNDVSLNIPDGEFIILVGPSGCGKSTTLNMIAGLEDITEGELRIGGKVVNDEAPKDRDIAMVFQSYALYPHMTVRENMGFALKLAKTPKNVIDEKVGEAARIFRAVAGASINIDMIVQNVSAAATGRTDISFTLPREDGQTAMTTLRALQDEVGFTSLLYDDQIGKISLIGAGMRSHPGVSATFFGALAEAGVNIEMISTSEIRISVVVDEKDVSLAVQATHSAFDLDSDEQQAVVYGGTGR